MTISKFLTCFRCFCLAPKIPNNPLKSVILSIYSFFSMFAIITILIYAFTLSDALTNDSLVVVVCALLTLNAFITDAIVIGNAFLGRDQINSILHNLDDIDKIMIDRFHHNDLINIPSRYMKKYFLAVSFIVLSYLYCFLVSQSMDVVLAVHPLLILRIRSVQIWFFVDLVDTRFVMLSKDLNTVVHKYNSSKWDAITQELTYQQIATLKTLYRKLWSLTLAVNKCFGLSLLFLSVENVAELIINSFITFAAFFTSGVSVHIWKQSVFGTLPALVTFLVTCYSCHHCSANVLQ